MVLQFGNCFQYSKIIYILFFLKTKCTNIFIAWRFFCHFIKSVINSNLCFYLECRSKSAWFYMSESQLLLTKNPSVFLSFFDFRTPFLPGQTDWIDSSTNQPNLHSIWKKKKKKLDPIQSYRWKNRLVVHSGKEIRIQNASSSFLG